MTLRPAFFSNVGLKLDTDGPDKSPAGAGHSCKFVSDVHDVLGDIIKSGGQLFSKSKKLDENHHSRVARHPLATALGSEQSERAEARQMGAEGTPVKSKSTLGQSNVMDVKTEFVAVNVHGNSRNAVGEGTGSSRAAPLEISSEGKRKNVKKSPGHPHSQTTCLRQLLLLQLDLIEQQQQQLQAKDKEIEELKADRDTLLARIERMERRLQLTSKEPRDKRLFQPLERWRPDTDDFWDVDLNDVSSSSTPKSLPFSRGGKVQKRKFSALDSKIQKFRGKAPKSPSQKAESGEPSPSQCGKETTDPSGSGHLFSSDREDSLDSTRMEDLPYLSTTEMYLCCWHQPPLSPLNQTSPKKEEDVAIPSWRERIVEPLSDKSGLLENLEDGVFLKRHAKLELDEKRRKRWDIQRIREQRMLQRLQQRMEKKSSSSVQESEPELCSFYPEAEDVESIAVTPFLPVVAFGCPLPNLTPQSFELPWLDERSRCRIENQKKQTPHRTCRK